MKTLLSAAIFVAIAIPAIAQVQPTINPNPNYPANYPNPNGSVMPPANQQVGAPIPSTPNQVNPVPTNGNLAPDPIYNTNRQNSPGNTVTPVAEAPARDGYLNGGAPDRRANNTGDNTDAYSTGTYAPPAGTNSPTPTFVSPTAPTVKPVPSTSPQTTEVATARNTEVTTEPAKRKVRKYRQGTGTSSSRSGRSR